MFYCGTQTGSQWSCNKAKPRTQITLFELYLKKKHNPVCYRPVLYNGVIQFQMEHEPLALSARTFVYWSYGLINVSWGLLHLVSNVRFEGKTYYVVACLFLKNVSKLYWKFGKWSFLLLLKKILYIWFVLYVSLV